ncbi:hypothetical protein O181_026287 [Austropuccinia psidii MF-1]|uniref:ELP1 first N-terminal beta-propeller domain-containing protein n=1 Tax=Austropuccinia psidii MF-1 TaxID=1389203 RepID=A0A9Q3CQ97_9BASI|nr:hypothetical protein [Austropuccinia psidii MF-1]
MHPFGSQLLRAHYAATDWPEAPIDFARFGDDQPVNLGWGTKSTQFHGSLGKPAAQVSEAETLPFATIPPKSFSLNAYELSWKGNGA